MKKLVYAIIVLGFTMSTCITSIIKADVKVSDGTIPTSSSGNEQSTQESTITDVSSSETTISSSSTSDAGGTVSDSQSPKEDNEEKGTTTTATDLTPTTEVPQKIPQDVIDIIGTGENFDSKKYLKYFEDEVTKIFKEHSDNIGIIPVYLLGLFTSQKGENFGVDQSVIQHLMGTYILYDIAFAKDSNFMSLMDATNDGTSPSENTGLYPNTETLTGVSVNHQDDKEMNLKAYYVNQNSDKTVIIHSGFRGNWNNGVVTPEYDSFYNAGYNLLFVDSRATGGSDGDYVTYGQYESDDVLYWVNQEIEARPKQKILLYGGSMGASTVMSALAKGVPQNVKGIIENCGFSSIDQQLRFTYINMVAPALGDLGNSLGLDIVANTEHEDLYMNLLKENYFDKELNLNTTQNLPEIGMSNTAIPKLIIHGSSDNVVPVSNATNLYSLSQGYKDILIVNGAGHGEAQKIDPVAYNSHLTNFLKVVFDDEVKVRYVDEQDNSLISSDFITLPGAYGDPYKTEQKVFEGYQFISVQGKSKGNFNEKSPTVTYKYKKIVTPPASNSSDSSDVNNSASQLPPTSTATQPSTISTNMNEGTSARKNKSLPITGEESTILSWSIGIVLVIISGIIFILRMRDKKNENT